MKKRYYKIIKNELQQRRNNTKYFNYTFFVTYIQALKDREKAIKAGLDESYKKGYITLYHYYDEIYKTDFYNKNSAAYCQFLEVVNPYNNKLLTV
jgi:hypothetical protein